MLQRPTHGAVGREFGQVERINFFSAEHQRRLRFTFTRYSGPSSLT
jgi:hypothetical protein